MPAEMDLLQKIRQEHLATATEKIVVGDGLAALREEIPRLRQYGGIVGLFDSNTAEAVGAVPCLDKTVVLDARGLHADERAVNEALSHLDGSEGTIVAFGSGTITDIARYCAKDKGLRLVSCPTAASVDGFCSSVCAMTFRGTKVTLPGVAPVAVFADLSVVAHAPVRLTRSGLGDILGKYISLADWRISHILTGEAYSEPIARLVEEALTSVTELAGKDMRGNDFCKRTLDALLLSGLAMQAVGSSRPASGAEHHFSHLIAVSPKPLGLRSDALHGESVGVGTLAVAERYRLLNGEIPTHVLQNADVALRKIKDNGDVLKDMQFYRDNFGDLAESLYDENRPDSLSSVDNLANAWSGVARVLENIPTPQRLARLFDAFGLKKTLSDIGIEDGRKDALLALSPFMRNRLTLNRLLLLFE